MVMKNVMGKNLRQSIKKSLTRYLAIVAIIALGAGIFVGLRATKSDMVATGQQYMDGQNMFDLQLISAYGWGLSQLEQIRQLPGVDHAEGVITLDALAEFGSDGTESVYKFYAIPESVSKVYLLGGRMPTRADECLVDGFHKDDSILGKKVTVSQLNSQETLEQFTTHTYTVVGYVSTPLYMDMSRGSTTLGNGSVSGYFYMPRESFDVDYYTMVEVSIPGNYPIYTEEYDLATESAADTLKPMLEPLAMDRYDQVRLDAENAYQEGLSAYEEGYQTYLDGKAEALRQLSDGEQELLDAQRTVEENLKLLEDGKVQLAEGELLLQEKKQELADGEAELNRQERKAKEELEQANLELLENYKTVTENLALVNDGIIQLDDGLSQLNDGISQLESGLQQLQTGLNVLKTLNSTAESGIGAAQAALDQALALGMPESVIQPLKDQLANLNEQRKEYAGQITELEAQSAQYSAQLAQLKEQRWALEAQRQELLSTKQTLESALAQINDGFAQLESGRQEAEEQIAQARKEIRDGKTQLAAAEKELQAKKQELAQGEQELLDAQTQLQEGWQEFNIAKEEALQELADGEAELMDAKQQLEEARHTIDTMSQPDVYTLDRNTNPGYLSLDSSSDIVKGVSTVFPAFFLLIAALVCITTMTRMVEEERTEIGTLKALGYTNREIIGKYLLYSGSAAILGCGAGVLIGSVVFPIILWEAYGIMLNLVPQVVLQVDWLLCGGVVVAYTAVNLLVTWYCCRRILVNEPAELIRPKPPTTGKKIFLEYLPFWNRIGFLNKVMLRNIFRYTQRLLMMLIGIGGCTALLLTGFGIRDSIADIADLQFQDITRYDMEIHFGSSQSAQDQQAFREEMERDSQQICFYHQSSIQLQTQEQAREVTLIAADDGLTDFLDFHYQGEPVPMPGVGQTLISVGVAQMMDIGVGDSVVLRNSDMQEMTVTVSGIYENYVYNFAIITPETHVQGWGQEPQIQVACLNVAQGQDLHQVSTRASKAEDVMRVMVCQDQAEQVGTMLEALDLVVITIVICAGALAGTVLYNLTNINITERIREIATIKVLGFRAGESAAYVFKENMLLSVMGAALGLIGGKFLLAFVISKIQVDMVWLQPRATAPSYVFAIVLTMLCAVLVDFILYFRLEKINMAEALKSVE